MDYATRDYNRDAPMAAQQTQAVGEKMIRADRAISSVIDRLRKIDTVFTHAVARATELRARVLGDREPSSIEQGRDRGMNDAKTPPPASELDELRRAVAELETTSEALHRQLEGLERL